MPTTAERAKMQGHGAIVVASEEARENMVDGKQPGLPTVTFEREANIWLGGKHVQMYHFGRAHTNGDIVVLFPADRTLASGAYSTFGDAKVDRLSGGGSAEGGQVADSGAHARLRHGRAGTAVWPTTVDGEVRGHCDAEESDS